MRGTCVYRVCRFRGIIHGAAGIAQMTEDDRTAELTNKLVEATNGKTDSEEIARAIYRMLRVEAKAEGQNPDIEVSIYSPAQIRKHSPAHGDCWVVNWEAGPHDWAVHATLNGLNQACGKCIEPYYGFDLCIPK